MVHWILGRLFWKTSWRATPRCKCRTKDQPKVKSRMKVCVWVSECSPAYLSHTVDGYVIIARAPGCCTNDQRPSDYVEKEESWELIRAEHVEEQQGLHLLRWR